MLRITMPPYIRSVLLIGLVVLGTAANIWLQPYLTNVGGTLLALFWVCIALLIALVELEHRREQQALNREQEDPWEEPLPFELPGGSTTVHHQCEMLMHDGYTPDEAIRTIELEQTGALRIGHCPECGLVWHAPLIEEKAHAYIDQR